MRAVISRGGPSWVLPNASPLRPLFECRLDRIAPWRDAEGVAAETASRAVITGNGKPVANNNAYH
jgi:hypothetical protein